MTGDTKVDNAENNAGFSCSLFNWCNLITEDNTDTTEDQINSKTNTDEESIVLQQKNCVLERKVKEAEETINTLTKEKSVAEESINNLTKEKSEAEADYKLKVETLENENAKLREELSKKGLS